MKSVVVIAWFHKMCSLVRKICHWLETNDVESNWYAALTPIGVVGLLHWLMLIPSIFNWLLLISCINWLLLSLVPIDLLHWLLLIPIGLLLICYILFLISLFYCIWLMLICCLICCICLILLFCCMWLLVMCCLICRIYLILLFSCMRLLVICCLICCICLISLTPSRKLCRG